jgi:putative ABC transport system permease protein
VPLVRGRDFTARDGEPGREAAIVNQLFAETYFPHADVLGRRIRVKAEGSPLARSWFTVVGVSPNVRQAVRQVSALGDPVIYLPYSADPPVVASMLVRGRSEPQALAAPLRTTVREIDPDLALYRTMTLGRSVAEADWNSRMSSLLITIIACIAIGLAAVGLYAVTAHAAALRTQEIGVRIALGATSRQLLWLLLRRAIVQLSAGLGLGVIAVLVWSRLFGGSYGSARLTDVEGLAMAGALLVVLGTLASLVPAVRASRLNPVVALRYE